MCGVIDMPHADQVRNYARWRPGWYAGRTSYAWLLPLGGQPGLRDLVNQYQYALRDLPGFDPVPLEWMHILVQEIGFSDEVDRSKLDSLVPAVRERITGTAPLSLVFQRAVVLPESLALPAEPQSTVRELRDSVRSGVADVFGGEHLPGEPEEIDQHISLAHSSQDGPAIFAVATLGATSVDPASVRVPSLSLVELNRDHSCSEWETIAELPFDGTPE
ncbi:2'-5' RNA ligase family protein [Bounagaea algeriensis]